MNTLKSAHHELLRELENTIQHSRQVNYLNMASTTVMVLDWLLTLDLEVSLIWKSKWNIGTVLYLISRYLTFLDVVLVMYHQHGFGLSKSTCQRVFETLASENMSGVLIVELVLTLRTISICSKSKRFTWGLSLMFATMSVGALITFGLYLKNLKHDISPAPGLVGCIIISSGPRYLSANFLFFMIFDGYLLVVMITRCIADYRSGGLGSPFLRVVYSDGIIYYIYIFGLAFLNALILIKLSVDYQTLLLLLQRVIHSVLTCRVVLDIRHQIVIDATSWKKNLEVCSTTSAEAETNNLEQHLDGNTPVQVGRSGRSSARCLLTT